MDRRGLTIDPNADTLHPAWYDSLGATQQPSPYATASWAYRHSWVTEEQASTSDEPVEINLDNGADFANYAYEAVYDGGFFNTPRAGAAILDEGGFTSSGEPVKFQLRYFGSVKVYDTYASMPNPSRPDQRVLKDGDGTLGSTAIVVDPADGLFADNGNDILSPNPSATVYNSESYPRSGLGLILNEMVFQIADNGDQEIIDNSRPENVDYDDDDVPRGTLLGQVSYEIYGSNLTITDWSHYNWHDATPIRKAVKILLKEKPDCAEIVMVENRPTPMWTSLGFCYPFKGSNMLIHEDSLNKVSTY